MPKRKILLVDDEVNFLKSIGESIKSWGYEVMESSSGEEALAALKNKKPDIMILDYRMPEKDGIATLREIRRINKRIQVIIFTAYPDEKSIRESEKLGISAYIPKLSVYTDSQDSLKSAIILAEKNIKKRSMKRRG